MAATGLFPVGPRLMAWLAVVAPRDKPRGGDICLTQIVLAANHWPTGISPVVPHCKIMHGDFLGALSPYQDDSGFRP